MTFKNKKEYDGLHPDCTKGPLDNNDPVLHPAHYTFSKFEVLDVLTEWFPEEPLLWQVCKYISRAKHKGKELEDLKKARFYLNKKIEILENQDVNN